MFKFKKFDLKNKVCFFNLTLALIFLVTFFIPFMAISRSNSAKLYFLLNEFNGVFSILAYLYIISIAVNILYFVLTHKNSLICYSLAFFSHAISVFCYIVDMEQASNLKIIPISIYILALLFLALLIVKIRIFCRFVFPKLKQKYSDFKSRTTKPSKPTKSERIAQLEHRLSELEQKEKTDE